MVDEAELCDLTVDLLCLSQELIHAKLRLENSAKVRTDVLKPGAEQRRTFYQCCGSIQEICSGSDFFHPRSMVDKIPDPLRSIFIPKN